MHEGRVLDRIEEIGARRDGGGERKGDPDRHGGGGTQTDGTADEAVATLAETLAGEADPKAGETAGRWIEALEVLNGSRGSGTA